MVNLRSALHELRRRNVIRAGIAYIASGWLVLQIANVVSPALGAPAWLLKALIIALVVGSPVALLLAWFFEFTPEGLKRTHDAERNAPVGHRFGQRVDFVIIGLLAGALALSVYANIRGPVAPPEPISILIADFDNETGSELFSGVVEETLRVGLEVAPFIDVFSRKDAASVAAALEGADSSSTPLSSDVASVVALREGVDIVVAGRLARTAKGLTIEVRGIAPGDQRELFAATQTAATDADVLSAIAAVSKELRLDLGDTEKPVGAGASESFAVGNLEAAAEYLKAQDFQLDRKLEEAVVHYEKALDLDPDFARAYAGLALTQYYLGRADAAGRSWQNTLSRLDQLTERGQLRTLGNYYYIYQRDYDKALETYERLAARYPSDNVAQANLATAAFNALDFDRALEAGREIADRFPHHIGFRANLALYAMYAGHFDEAAAVAQRVLEADPDSAYALFVLAQTRAIAGDLEAAEETYRRMLQSDQYGKSVAEEGLADLAIYRGEPDTAIEVLDAAIESEVTQKAEHTAALKQTMLARLLMQTGEQGQALSTVDSALRNAGDEPAVLVPASFVLAELRESDQAEAIAAQLSESPSKSQQAYANAIRAQLAYVRGASEDAIAEATAGLEFADLWLIHLVRANAYAQAGRATEAAADLQVCRDRIGEGIAVFLNDRPSLRMLRELEAAAARVPRSGESSALGQ